jgi:hypothetical protein
MKIQEMRSGIEHLSKKVETQPEQHEDYFWPERSAAAPRLAEPEPDVPAEVRSDLDAAQWSVVSFRRREAGGLTYRQASELMEFLDGRGVYGLCIITDDAAVRYSAKETK